MPRDYLYANNTKDTKMEGTTDSAAKKLMAADVPGRKNADMEDDKANDSVDGGEKPDWDSLILKMANLNPTQMNHPSEARSNIDAATTVATSTSNTTTNTSKTPNSVTTVITTVTTTTVTTSIPPDSIIVPGTHTITINGSDDDMRESESDMQESSAEALDGTEEDIVSPGSDSTLLSSADDAPVAQSPDQARMEVDENGNSAASFLEHLQSLREVAKNLQESGMASRVEETPDVARVNLANTLENIAKVIRPPPDAIMNWFCIMCQVSAVRLFQHWGVFDLIPVGRDGGISYADLAAKVDAETSLLYRVASMLTSTGVLQHVQPDKLAHTPISLLLRENEPMGSMFKVMYTNVLETSTILPQYFDTHGRKEPVDLNQIPATFLEGKPELSFFELLNQDPAKMKNFMRAMSITNRGRVPITGMYPMDDVIQAANAQASPAGAPIWVDVGGGGGHTVKTFCLTYPDLPAERCVVQDLPEVCKAAAEQAKEDEVLQNVTWVPIDFHKEPPIEGALIYYLRHIARDYSDAVLFNILFNIRQAMKRPDSKILIAEGLAPSTPPLPVYAAFKDYSMMAIGGKERSLEGFKSVIEAAGLELSAVYKDRDTPQAIIECSLPEHMYSTGAQALSTGDLMCNIPTTDVS